MNPPASHTSPALVAASKRVIGEEIGTEAQALKALKLIKVFAQQTSCAQHDGCTSPGSCGACPMAQIRFASIGDVLEAVEQLGLGEGAA
jgi:hypothetical protein